MYRVTCKQCGASGITMDGTQLQAAVSCSCCTEPHDHDQAANTCDGATAAEVAAQHPDVACAHPTEGGIGCNAVTEVGEECPGGHCYPGVAGCTVCRPVTVELLYAVPVGAQGQP